MASAYPIVALWCVPRSVSTAFERMIAARGDLRVITEPFSDSYYFAPDRVSQRYKLEQDADYKSFEDALAAIHQAAEEGPVFFKDMAYHALRYLNPSILSCFTNIVLIRDPRLSLVSLYRRMPDFTMEETGFEALVNLVALLDDINESPFVMDGEILRADPEGVSRSFCNAVDIPFKPDSLHWRQGEEAHWDRWQSWFSEAAQSTQFHQPEKTFDPDPLSIPHVSEALALCKPQYRELRARVKPVETA